MTALQDWLSVSRVDPHRIKAVIRTAWRCRITEECRSPNKPDQLRNLSRWAAGASVAEDRRRAPTPPMPRCARREQL